MSFPELVAFKMLNLSGFHQPISRDLDPLVGTVHVRNIIISPTKQNCSLCKDRKT